MSSFYSGWKESRKKAAEMRKKSFISKFTDFIVILFIVILVCTYIYSSMKVKFNPMNQGSNSISNHVETKETEKGSLKEKAVVENMGNPIIFILKFFRISMIDTIVFIIIIAFYLYFRYYRNIKYDRESE